MNRSAFLLAALAATVPLSAGRALQAPRPEAIPASIPAGVSAGVREAAFRVEPPPARFPQDPADSLYRAARAALNQNDYRGAARRFREIQERFPRSAYAADAPYWEAFALYRMGGTESLRTALERLEGQRRAHPNAGTRGDADALATRIRGELARLGDSDAAAQVAQQATRATQDCSSEDEDMRAAALNALLQMNSERALPILRQVLARRDQCSAPLREKALFIISQTDSPEAGTILLDAARSDPSVNVREKAVFWLSQVPGERAVAMLEQILRSSGEERIREQALFALSQHEGERAAQLLRSAAEGDGLSDALREKAIFWLGQSDSRGNSEFLRGLYPRLQSRRLKEQVLFAVSQREDAAGRGWLLEVAMNEQEPVELRKKAIFWAGQSGMPVAELSALYDRLTSREMREQVIFALSQREESAAVDRLIQIARSERDAELRKRAIFWLSQSDDPRVAELLLEIIQR